MNGEWNALFYYYQTNCPLGMTTSTQRLRTRSSVQMILNLMQERQGKLWEIQGSFSALSVCWLVIGWPKVAFQSLFLLKP